MPSRRIFSAMTLSIVFAALNVATPMQQARTPAPAPPDADPRLGDFKAEVMADVEARRDFTQQMVDSILGFSELGGERAED